MEAAGAELGSHRPLGAWKLISSLAKPYRLHLPHPVSYRYVLFGEIKLTGSPSNPEDGEDVVAVDGAGIDEIASRFESINRLGSAKLYKLAHAIKTQ